MITLSLIFAAGLVAAALWQRKQQRPVRIPVAIRRRTAR